jgi:uncharacterized damage-inducible protein DinB
MPTTDPIAILLMHDKWATQQTLNACSTLTRELFHQRFDVGPCSLHDTTTHMLGAMRGWGDLLAGREFGPRLEGTQRSVPELLTLLEEVTADFAASARAHPLDGLVTRSRDGKSYTVPRVGVITHVTTHGMHHGAQCLNMLRHVGVTPLPQSSVLQWMLAGEGR